MLFRPVVLLTSVTALASEVSASAPSSSASTPAPPLCNNQGLEWGYWYNPYPYPKVPLGWQNYDPAFTNNADPEHTGVISSILSLNYTNATKTLNVYNQFPNASQVNLTLNHQGYIFAPKTGTYTFNVSSVDNNFNLWVGNTAYGYPYEQWVRNNSVINVWTLQTIGGAGTYKVHFTGGTYNPFRYALGQAGSDLMMNLEVLDPTGKSLFPPGSHSPNLVRYACHGASGHGGQKGPNGKPFVPFGLNYKKEVAKCGRTGGCVDYYGACISPGCYVGKNKTCVAAGQTGCSAPPPYGY